MRRYCIASGLLLILPIIDFAVSAPVLVRKKPESGVDVVHTITMLGKRSGELDELLSEFFDHPEGNFRAKPEELSAAHPLSSPPPSGSADVSMDVAQPLMSTPNGPSQLSIPDRAPLNPGDELNKMWLNLMSNHDNAPLSPGDELNKMWLNLMGYPEGHVLPKPGELSESAAQSSSSSAAPGPVDESMDVEQPLQSIPKVPLQVSSQDHVPPGRGDELNEPWLKPFGHSEDHLSTTPDSEGPSAARPSSSSPLSVPADGSTDVEQALPSIHEEPLPVSGQDNVSPNRGDELNELWLELFGQAEDHLFTNQEGSSAARPSSSSQLSEPAGGPMDVEQPLPYIHEEALPVSGQDHVSPNRGDGLNELWLELFGNYEDHLSPKPEGSSASHPSSSSPLSGPAGGLTDIKQPLSSIHEEPLPVSGQDHVSPNKGDELNKLFGNSDDHLITKPEGSSAARPSSSSAQSGPTNGWTDVMQLLSSIVKETSPVSSPDHVPPSRGDELNEPWLKPFGHSEDQLFAKPQGSSAAARPSSSSAQLGPANGWTDVMRLLPSILEETSPVSSPDHVPPSRGDELNEPWFRPFGQSEDHLFAKPQGSSAVARPSSSSPQLGPANGWADVMRLLPSILKETSPVSSPDHAPPSPGSLTESRFELMKGMRHPGRRTQHRHRRQCPPRTMD
ncbi:hypothetical protein BGY98DRAFT_704040 [Russula aff. rugulosa BPL654]|nr:hypothetical protein BGY98DRAFT_704040 [Russula aff. rugulosa BPL654]